MEKLIALHDKLAEKALSGDLKEAIYATDLLTIVDAVLELHGAPVDEAKDVDPPVTQEGETTENNSGDEATGD